MHQNKMPPPPPPRNLVDRVKIVCQGKQFRCSKSLLVDKSEFFRAMFSSGMRESDATEVRLRDVDADDFARVLTFMQTRRIKEDSCDSDDLVSLLRTASYLQVTDLIKQCMTWLGRRVNATNFVDLWDVALQFATPEERGDFEKTLALWVDRKFDAASASAQFVNLGLEQLTLVLTQPGSTNSLEARVRALLEWVRFKEQERRDHLPYLVALLDLRELSNRFLGELTTTEPLMAAHPELFLPLVTSRLRGDTDLVERGSSLVCIGLSDKCSYTCFHVRRRVWSEVRLIPFVLRQGMCVVSCDDRIFFVGGEHFPKQTHEFRPHNNSVALLTDALYPVLDSGSASMEHCVYVVGGCKSEVNEDPSRKVQCFDLSDSEWRRCAPTLQPHLCPAVVALNSRLYVMGSYDSADVECYSPDADQWAHVTNLPLMGAYITDTFAAAWRDEILVAYDDDKKMRAYNPERNTWSLKKEAKKLPLDVVDMSSSQNGGVFLQVMANDYETRFYLSESSCDNDELAKWGLKTRFPMICRFAVWVCI